MKAHNLSSFILLGVVAAMSAACQTATESDLESIHSSSQAVSTSTSAPTDTLTTIRVIGRIFDLAGRDLNGTALNGKVLDGHIVVSVDLSSAMVQGTKAKSVVLDGSVFSGRTASGKQIKPDQWIGAEFSALLDDGETITLKIEERVHSKESYMRDVIKYVVSYPTVNGRLSLCGDDSNGKPIAAIALQGRWDYRAGVDGGGAKIEDPSTFTLACDGFVLAKCVEMGYHPWWPVVKCTKGQGCVKSTLSDYHQACARMLRADYCGNGLSHTVDGTAINAYDSVGVRADGEDWPFEAEWTASGARCAAVERIAEPALPSCWQQLRSSTCGSLADFDSGSLLFSEVQYAH